MYTNIMIGDKNLVIIGGGALIIIMLLMYILTQTNNPASKYLPRNSYSTPAVNQIGQSEMNVLLSPQNNSGESGMANLKDTSGIATVTLSLIGYTPNVVQPAHIHIGACPGVGAVKYPLNSVVNGKSVTVLGVGIAQLKQQLPLAINVHKSATEIATYTSCGSL